MATPYHDVLADIALRVNALEGTVPADLQTTYATRPLTSSIFDSSMHPFDALIAALGMAEQKLVNAIANSSPSNPYRVYLASTTANLASGDAMPEVDTGSQPIVGVYGAVRDGSDSTVCTARPLREITRRIANAGSFYRVPAYYYTFEGNRIYHTRTNVKVDVCIYNHDTQIAAIEANSNMLLPDDLYEALVCGGLTSLVRDDEFTEQAKLFGEYFLTSLKRFNPVVTA